MGRMKELVVGLTAFGFSVSPFFQPPSHLPEGVTRREVVAEKGQVLAEKSLDLTTRNEDPWVSEVMADNILLTLHYLKEDLKKEVVWEEIRKPFSASFALEPGEVFAFHQDILPEFEEKAVKTTGATFHSDQGFKSDGYLFGDGVCHLASLMNWVAVEAGLRVGAAVNHDFWPVPGVPQEFGTAIYYLEGSSSSSQLQNLYLENVFDFPVEFVFIVDNQQVELRVLR